MAITIDYSQTVEQKFIINIPKADMTLIETVPTEVRELNLDTLRTTLGDLSDDAQGIAFPTIHEHTAAKTVAGVTLARVVEIDTRFYRVEFEDLLYNVNVVGGNSNIADVQVKNQVGVNTANSAGLQDTLATLLLELRKLIYPLYGWRR